MESAVFKFYMYTYSLFQEDSFLIIMIIIKLGIWPRSHIS